MGKEGSLPLMHTQEGPLHLTYSRSKMKHGLLHGSCSQMSLQGYITKQIERLASKQVDFDRDFRDPILFGFEESLALWISAKREHDSLQGVATVT